MDDDEQKRETLERIIMDMEIHKLDRALEILLQLESPSGL